MRAGRAGCHSSGGLATIHLVSADDTATPAAPDEPIALESARPAPANRGSTASRALALATTAAAIFLGCLYALGAVLIAGQMHDVHLPLRDVLPLVPLPQMLGRGMSVLLSSPALLVVALLLFSVQFASASFVDSLVEHYGPTYKELSQLKHRVLAMEEGPDRRHFLKRIKEVERRLPPVFRVRTQAIMVVLGTIALIFGSTLAELGFVIAAGAFLLLGVFRVLRARLAVLGFVSLVALGLLVASFYYPQHLPRASIVTLDGRSVSGTLVVQTGNTFYLSTRPRHMIAIPSSEVRRALLLTYPKRRLPLLYRKLID
jgi:hypothetical protein